MIDGTGDPPTRRIRHQHDRAHRAARHHREARGDADLAAGEHAAGAQAMAGNVRRKRIGT